MRCRYYDDAVVADKEAFRKELVAALDRKDLRKAGMADRRVVSPTGKPKTLAPVRPNAGVEANYRKRLDRLISEMQRSVIWWVRAQWRSNTPEMAMDNDSPAMGLRAEMRTLGARWQSKFDEAALDLARYFATAAKDRSDASLRSILKRSGISVEFKMTAEANDVLQATIGANVALIKSIPAEHLKNVEGAVMRSVQTGRDLGALTKELQQAYGVTRRRAAFIARSQNNIATASMTKVRQTALGITKARWLHSGGGKHPRPEHVAFAQGRDGGPVYDVEKGAFLEGRWTWPGVEPNCRCVSRSIIEGF